MSSRTTASRPRQTTSSGSKGNRTQYRSGKLPPAAHVSFAPDIVGRRYGWVEIINPQKRWNSSWGSCYVETRCTGCGSTQWTSLNALTRGKTRGCQACSTAAKPSIPRWLDRRLTEAKQRCENPNNRHWAGYGGRGIQFRFPSILEAGLWILANIPEADRGLELDRIDTNGHYEPGNIRFVTRGENVGNRRNTVLSHWEQRYWPYARSTVCRKLAEGKSREQIIEDARKAVREKHKGWHTIDARLEFMTYSMPDHVAVSPYRTPSSTTAATRAAWEPSRPWAARSWG